MVFYLPGPRADTGLTLLPFSASLLSTISGLQIQHRAPDCPGRRGSSPGRPRPAPGLPQAPAFPSARPLRPGRAPRTLLFTSMVPRQPLPAPCRWLRFMLRPGPAAASSSLAAPRERGERVRGQRALDVAAAREPPHRHLQGNGCGSGLRGELCLAGSLRCKTEGPTGRAAGGDTTPSLRASAAPAKEEEEGAEHRRQELQLRARQPLPRARARAHPTLAGGVACARSPAASLEAWATRAPSTPNRKRAPAPAAPANRYGSSSERGRATFSKIPPTSARLASLSEGGAGSPEASGLSD